MASNKFEQPITGKSIKKSDHNLKSSISSLQKFVNDSLIVNGDKFHKIVFVPGGDPSWWGPPKTHKPTAKPKKKAAKVKKMSADSAIVTSAPTIAIGRSHNPFTGVSELLVFPETGDLADKVRAELAKTTKPIEVEVTESKITVRPLRRTAQAAVKIALDLHASGAITAEQALNSVPLRQLNKLMTASVADFTGLPKIGTGMIAAPGIAVGRIAASAKAALEMAAKGDKVILKVSHTTPEDMEALKAVVGIIAETGGYTSHSAIVARQMGKPCIVSFVLPEPGEGTTVTMDGGTGTLYLGEAKITETGISDETKKFISLADSISGMKVFANADTPEDVVKAIEMGAAGIGLCRTEHTFFTEKGTRAIRRLIMSQSATARNSALVELMKVQVEHFKNYFAPLGDIPVTIRLLDPPMHEFLPSIDDKVKIKELAKDLKLTQIDTIDRIEKLKESNPMLGHRGCRLGITFDGLYATQVKSILRGMYEATFGYGVSAKTKKRNVGIMIPLISNVAEMRESIKQIKQAITESWADLGGSVSNYFTITVGAMIETPRACLITYDLAEMCDFFSFGTNDLTQTTWALSRDDSKFMLDYKSKGIVSSDPFESLDVEGVGQLMDHAIAMLGDRRSKVKVGICGEHGGDPESISFCNKLKLDYVSCSPSRIRLARLASALAKIPGQVSSEIEVQEINLAPIVSLAKKDPPPVKVTTPPDADKLKVGKSPFTTPAMSAKGDFSNLNKVLGTWLTEKVPTVCLAWEPLQAVTASSYSPPLGEEYWYVKYHNNNDEHVIVTTVGKQLVKSLSEIACTQFTNGSTHLLCTVPTPKICAIAEAIDLKPEIVSVPVANATDTWPAVIAPIVTPVSKPSMPSMTTLKAMKLEAVTEALAGKFVKTTDNVWCKVIGCAPNPYQSFALAVLLPKNASTSPASAGPLKPFFKLASGMSVEDSVLTTKLKYVNWSKIVEISDDKSVWTEEY